MNTTIDKKSARATDLTTGEVTYFNSMSDVKRQLGIPTSVIKKIVKKSIMVEQAFMKRTIVNIHFSKWTDYKL